MMASSTTASPRQAIAHAMADIVPHAGAMILLDRPLDGDADNLACEVTIPPSGLFCRDGGVGNWVGLEYMAQAVAAWAGWQARLRGESPKIGFLLGSRRYECARPQFKTGEVLRVDVHRVYQADNGLSQFDCRIQIAGDTVASATLTVFEPKDAAAFLQTGATGE